MTNDQPTRVAVLLSGGGTTLQNLIDRISAGHLRAEIALVIGSRADAFGLERAKNVGIAHHAVARKACASREEFSARVFDLCRQAQVDLVCLAGFLQLIDIPD